jgi:hypothetical protein
MATVKRVSGDYTINSQLVTINGNLVVTGNTTTINTTETVVQDNVITLNGNLSASSAPVLNAGIEVNRGTQPTTALRWNESFDAWQLTNDGSTYANIAVASSTGGVTINANLDMKEYTLYSSTTANVSFDSNVSIKNTLVAPTAVSGYNVIYAQTPSGGGSGLFVTNTTTTAQELATKAAAIKYSIIFG